MDPDGLCVNVAPSSAITFRYDYRLSGRCETLTIGKYGACGLSPARTREQCIDARRVIGERRSPAREKRRAKPKLKEAKSFGEFAESWFQKAPMADSTKAVWRSIYERELLPVFRNRLLQEITPDDLRALCERIVDRSWRATANSSALLAPSRRKSSSSA